MPRLLVVLCLLTVIAGCRVAAESGAAGGAGAPGRSLRVATYNVHFGSDERERYNLQRTVDVLASLDADLIGAQELLRNHAQYRCDDQPAQIAEGLRRATGRPWRYVYVNEWVTENRECLEAGLGDGVETEGLAFFTAEPSLDVDYVRLWHTRIGLRARIPKAPDVSVIVTHLAHSAVNLSDRRQQIDQLVPWSGEQGPFRVLMGDFNAAPGSPELAPVTAMYRDAWADAAETGKARGVTDGSTRPGRSSRIDYVMYTPAARWRIDAVDVVDSSGWLQRWEASDHRPVVATFRLTE